MAGSLRSLSVREAGTYEDVGKVDVLGKEAGEGTIGEWTRGPPLGSGAFGDVYLGLERQAGTIFAVKTVDADRYPDRLLALENEMDFLRSIDSPSVIKCLGSDWTFEDGVRKRNMMIEHMPGGSVSDLMKNFGGRLDEGLIRKYAKGLLSGLRDLHDLRISHGDIKGKNLLVGANGEVKLCDFGSAERLLDEDEDSAPEEVRVHPKVATWLSTPPLPDADKLKATEVRVNEHKPLEGEEETGGGNLAGAEEGTKQVAGDDSKLPGAIAKSAGNRTAGPSSSRLRGTVCWMAPEVVVSMAQGTAADIWSAGCTVLEMAKGGSPWDNKIKDAYSALYQIGFTEAVPDIPQELSSEAHDFLSRCLQRNPDDRPSAAELLEHPFLTQPYSRRPELKAVPPKPRSVLTLKNLLEPTNVDSPTSVLANGTWESAESTVGRNQVQSPPATLHRRSFSEAGPSPDYPRVGAPARCPSMGFPSFKKLTEFSESTKKERARPPLALQIPSANGSAGSGSSSGDGGGSQSWYWSPTSPTAAQGKWLTVHSPHSPPSSPSMAEPFAEDAFFTPVDGPKSPPSPGSVSTPESDKHLSQIAERLARGPIADSVLESPFSVANQSLPAVQLPLQPTQAFALEAGASTVGQVAGSDGKGGGNGAADWLSAIPGFGESLPCQPANEEQGDDVADDFYGEVRPPAPLSHALTFGQENWGAL